MGFMGKNIGNIADLMGLIEPKLGNRNYPRIIGILMGSKWI